MKFVSLTNEKILRSDYMTFYKAHKGKKKEWKLVGNLMKEIFPGRVMKASNFQYYIFRRPIKMESRKTEKRSKGRSTPNSRSKKRLK
jgi:hypothetical protein